MRTPIFEESRRDTGLVGPLGRLWDRGTAELFVVIALRAFKHKSVLGLHAHHFAYGREVRHARADIHLISGDEDDISASFDIGLEGFGFLCRDISVGI